MRKNFNIPSIRERLAGQNGKKYWRSLEEIAETEEFEDFLQHEFPQGADQWLNPIGRRNFMKLMAASFALGGLAACNPQRSEKIVPYVRAPEEIVPGIPLHFATAFELGGVATGVVAESHMGRPTKLDGNPDHPGSRGGTNALLQASILDLYDPDRSETVMNSGLLSTWDAFVSAAVVESSAQEMTGGAGFRLLTRTVTSPTLISQIEALLESMPEAQWIQYEPVNRDNAREGAVLAFGEDAHPVYQFDRAKVILSLESDFMSPYPGDVRYSRDFSDMRRVRSGEPAEMNRLYLVESTPTITGSMADHRLPLGASRIEALARAVAAELGLGVNAPEDVEGVPHEWITAVAEDLAAHAGEGLVLAGPSQPPAVHALAHAINEALGNVGQTLYYTEPLEGASLNQTGALQTLVADMENGDVDVLVIIDANPVFEAPADLDFAGAMENVAFKVHTGLYEDETAVRCQWHVPAKHFLESWGDSRAYDGTVTLIQPLVQPLYPASRSATEILAVLTGQPGTPDYDLVREYWTAQNVAANFESFWQESLFNGVVANTALPAKSVSATISNLPAAAEGAAEGLEIVYRPDPALWDGRFANNGWLMELPRPLTKLTWDNAALISPATAERIGISNEDVVILEHEGRNLYVPAWITPGQAENSVTLHFGFGRERAGRVGSGVGVNTYALRTSQAPWFAPGLTMRQAGETYRLASTQMHFNMEGRHLVKEGTLAQYEEDPHFVEHIGEHEVDPDLSLMPGWEYNSYFWGMVVDLSACNGCNACVIACQAENNIPVVGKEQVLVGREMHWMRIDAYFEGDLENPHALHQPMMCQHCEQAPCELVCPVNATVHDAEGLNVMVYNRCIGTRYCSNNCPYKVRRFNFLQYSDLTTEVLKGVRNPNVTVRVRGVMEKCTYCVQRISRARIAAKNENRRIRDGEVITACQAACPTQAIVFGDTNDPDSQIAQAKQEPQNYEVLSELGVWPRTSYLAKITNPNPALVTADMHGDEHG